MAGQVLPGYTPFVTQGMKGVRGAMMGQQERQIENQKNELASAAWMGDPQAMQELASMDPQMASQVETTVGKRQDRNRQTDLDQQADEDRTRKFAKDNMELMRDMGNTIGGFGDYENAKQFAAGQVQYLNEILGEENVPQALGDLPVEMYEQMVAQRNATGNKSKRPVGASFAVKLKGKDQYATGIIETNERTGETSMKVLGVGPDLQNPNLWERRKPTEDPGLAGDIAGAKETGKIEAQIDLADDKAISMMSAEAKVGLLPARTRAKNTIGIIEQLRNHPGRKYATGIGWLNPAKYAPGTDAHDFMVLADQASGRVFAEAYETLKGGGQITEIESRKAEQAIARMETSQSQDEYMRALDEFEQATREGYKKLLDLASTTPEKFKQLMQGELSQPLPSTGVAGDATINNPARPSSREARDALPSGAYYIAPGDPTAKVRRKK